MSEIWDLPQVISIEKAVLGAMVLKEGLVIPKVSAILKEEDFYRPEHRLAYRRIMELYDRGEKPNLLLLVEELRQHGELEKVGGATFVMSIANFNFTTAFAESHAKKIKEKAILRRLIEVSEQISYEASQDLKPLNEILEMAEKKLREVTEVREASKSFSFNDFFANNFESEIESMKKYANRKTGFANIDDKQIFSPGLYVLGGLPALGKTTFAWQMLEQLARNGEKCIYCSYEMSKLELFTKSVARRAFENDRSIQITSAGIRRGESSEVTQNIIYTFAKTEIELRVMELQEQDIDTLLFELKKYCIDKAPVIVLDYLQIVPIKNADTTQKQAIDEIVRKLKNFQRETNTTFIVISSFNRANYSQQVAFESFKESGNIEYSADVVWGLQFYCTKNLREGTIGKNREIIEQAKKANPRQVQLSCLKNRQGTNYQVYFKYYPANDYFEECEEQEFQDLIFPTKEI